MIGTLFAHRGYHDKPQIPENSLAAFQRAIEHGWGCELDVHLTIDKQLVVTHDSKLYRVTGTEGTVEEFSLAYLKSLKLEGTEERIPSFREVLDLFESTPGPDGNICPMIVELKSYDGNHRELVETVCKMLDDYTGPYVLESFDPLAVMEIKKIRPNITRGQLVRNFTTKDSELPGAICFMLRNLLFNPLTQPDFVAYYYKDRNLPAIKKLIADNNKLIKGSAGLRKRKHIEEVVWTIKTSEGCRAALDAGVSAVIFENCNPEVIDEYVIQ